jgi:hypothetical protein
VSVIDGAVIAKRFEKLGVATDFAIGAGLCVNPANAGRQLQDG